MPNPLAEIQSRSQAAASTSGPASTIDKIVGTAGGDVNIPELQSTNLTVAHGNFTGGLQIPNWTVSTAYGAGNIVRRNNTIYLITANHTSQAVSNNFYIDWLTNGYLTPMSSAPGDIIYKVGASDTGLLALDGSEKLIASYPDLYYYLYGFASPISHAFCHGGGSGNRVTDNGGYAYFTIVGHGLVSGDMVYITLDTVGSPTFAYANKPYFVQRLDNDNFYISTENWSWTTNSGATNRLAYSAGLFGTTLSANNIYKTYWGHSLTPSTHFMLPDFRGLMVRNAGTNSYMVKYNRSNFASIAGEYKSDTGLEHSHSTPGYSKPPEFHLIAGAGDGGWPSPVSSNSGTYGVEQTRANETEFAPAHVVVNAYIRF